MKQQRLEQENKKLQQMIKALIQEFYQLYPPDDSDILLNETIHPDDEFMKKL